MSEFDLWCAVVNARLEDYTGRGLAELPISPYPLRTWYRHGVTAQGLAALLAGVQQPARVTLCRWYTDDRPARELERIAEHFRAARV